MTECPHCQKSAHVHPRGHNGPQKLYYCQQCCKPFEETMLTCAKCGKQKNAANLPCVFEHDRDANRNKKIMHCNNCDQRFVLDMETVSVTVPVKVPVERIQDLLICAFEGGSNYWYQGLHVVEDNGVVGEEGVHRFHLLATTPGGVIAFNADDEPETILTLNLEKCIEGLKTMAEKYPRHWADFHQENDDADTGDVFLQCCVFGEIVYG